MFARAVTTGLGAGIFMLLLTALILGSLAYFEIALEFPSLFYNFLWGLTVFSTGLIAAYTAKQHKIIAGLTATVSFLISVFLVNWSLFSQASWGDMICVKTGAAVLGGTLGSLLGTLFNSR